MQPKSRWAAWLSPVSSSSVQMALSTQIASSFIVLCFLAGSVGSGSMRPAAAPCFLARGGRYPGQMKMPMVRADEDANVDMHLFYLSSVLRMVLVDTQRVETGPVKCNSITKDPRVPRP